jgi:hypothetical protein
MILVNDYVSEAYLKYNLPIQLNKCVKNYGKLLRDGKSWDLAMEWIKNCLLSFFKKEDEYQINKFISEKKEKIIEHIKELVDKNNNRRKENEEEEKEEDYEEEEKEEKEDITGGKRRTKKRKYKRNNKTKRNKNKHKPLKTAMRKREKKKTSRKRHTRR